MHADMQPEKKKDLVRSLRLPVRTAIVRTRARAVVVLVLMLLLQLLLNLQSGVIVLLVGLVVRLGWLIRRLMLVVDGLVIIRRTPSLMLLLIRYY